MATKKKTKKKSTKAKKSATPKKKPAKSQRRKAAAPKKAVKKAAPKKAAQKKAAPAKNEAAKAPRSKAADGSPIEIRNSRRASAFSADMLGPDAGGQSGDLQGLSDVESADSESVDELVEEGNAFEAGIVTGVEDAGRQRTKEVTTREVPEDDVPGEYLDQD